MPEKIIPTKEKCPDCKNTVELKVDEAAKRVVVTCKTCKKRSVIVKGQVVADGEAIPEAEL
jgi:NAD-dependent SIR2 family protein deacetylase